MSSPQSFPVLSQREAIHDLRNLFGVIASARRLAQSAPEMARDQWLGAIALAAARGGEVTTHLLGAEANAAGVLLCLQPALTRIAPQLSALADPAALEFDLAPDARARLDAGTLEAVVLELVRNARRAGASRLRLRLRRFAAGSWLMLADDGVGLTRERFEAARAVGQGVHGSGLPRIFRAVEAAGGRVRLRGRPGQGTVLALILPADKTAALPTAPAVHQALAGLSPLNSKEMNHETVR